MHFKLFTGTVRSMVRRHSDGTESHASDFSNSSVGVDLQGVADVPIYGRIATLQLYRPPVSF